MTFFTSEMFFSLQYKGIIFSLCSIAQAVNRLVLCFCCCMKRVEITIVATMWLQKWKTKVLPFSWKHQLQDRCFFFQVFTSSCSKKRFSIPFVCLLFGFKASFTLEWLKSGKLFCTHHGKTNYSKEGKKIKILFIRAESWPHCPELLHCLNGLTCWCQGELCVDWSCSDLAASLFWAASGLVLQPRNISAALKGRRWQRWIISDLWSNSIFSEKEQQREQAVLPESTLTPCILLCWKTGNACLPWCSGTGKGLSGHCCQTLQGCPTSLSHILHMIKICLKKYGSAKVTVSAIERSVDWAGTSWDKTWQET